MTQPSTPADRLTGQTFTVERAIAADRETVWAAVTDLPAMAAYSPETIAVAWAGEPAGPVAGARFAGHNRRGDGTEWRVTGVVTIAEAPHRFEWVVLDQADDPGRPGSRWTITLAPGAAAGTTTVRQTYTVGPGDSGFRQAVVAHPDLDVTGFRLGQLRDNVIASLDALARHHGRSG